MSIIMTSELRLRLVYISGIQLNLANPSGYSEKLQAPGGPGFYFNDYCNWRNIGPFREFVTKSGIAALAGNLMRSKVCD